MQSSLDLFGDSINNTNPQVIAPKFSSRSYERAFKVRLEKRNQIQAQVGFFEEEDDATMYMSGVSSITDIKGCIQSNANICVNTIDITDTGTKALVDYLNTKNGGLTFIDSGAFRVIGTSDNKTINFDDVFAYYNKISFNVKYPERITICAPDIIGDQQASLELQQQYKIQLNALIAHGVNVIFPLQRGEKSLTQIYLELCNEFDKENVIAGLPAAIKAIPHTEFMAFLNIQPPRVHILGANKNKTLVKEAKYKSPTTMFSCDSNRILAYIGTGRPLTELCHDLTDDVISFYDEVIDNARGDVHEKKPSYEWIPTKYDFCLDYSEFDAESAILSFSPTEQQGLCDELKPYLSELELTPSKLVGIVQNDTILDYIQTQYNDGFAFVIHDVVWDYYRLTLKSKLNKSTASPMARTQAIYVSCDKGLFD